MMKKQNKQTKNTSGLPYAEVVFEDVLCWFIFIQINVLYKWFKMRGRRELHTVEQ